MLAARRARGEIGVSGGCGEHLDDAADAHLAIELRPVKQQRGVGILR